MKHSLHCTLLVFITLAFSLTLCSQSERDLKLALEGKRVEVLIDMPASSQGIDLYVMEAQPIEFDEYTSRVKDNGIAIYTGDVVMITKIKKKKKHIELQLAGGGFGTWSDESTYVSSNNVQKSNREKELEEILKSKKKIENRNKLKDELEDLKRKREREQQSNDRQANLESEMKKSRISEKKLQGGSRFNIKYDFKIGANEMTVESIQNALREYINFTPGNNPSETNNSNTAGPLSKGYTIEEVIGMYGLPKGLTTTSECNLEITKCSFLKENQQIDAVFVEGVLVRYSISSR